MPYVNKIDQIFDELIEKIKKSEGFVKDKERKIGELKYAVFDGDYLYKYRYIVFDGVSVTQGSSSINSIRAKDSLIDFDLKKWLDNVTTYLEEQSGDVIVIGDKKYKLVEIK